MSVKLALLIIILITIIQLIVLIRYRKRMRTLRKSNKKLEFTEYKLKRKRGK